MAEPPLRGALSVTTHRWDLESSWLRRCWPFPFLEDLQDVNLNTVLFTRFCVRLVKGISQGLLGQVEGYSGGGRDYSLSRTPLLSVCTEVLLVCLEVGLLKYADTERLAI